MSDIYGEGHGSAHDWQYCGSSPWKTSYYQCARCGHKFVHAYDSMDIFQAMKQQGVPAECQLTKRKD